MLASKREPGALAAAGAQCIDHFGKLIDLSRISRPIAVHDNLAAATATMRFDIFAFDDEKVQWAFTDAVTKPVS
jgi:hypothetical protein